MKPLLLFFAAFTNVVIGAQGHVFGDKLVKEFRNHEDIGQSLLEKTKEGIKLAKQLKNNMELHREVLIKAKKVINGCQCVEYNCGCCGRIVVKKVKFDETICVNASYLPKEYGIQVTITLNDLVLLNQSISAKNPPPLCAGVPHVKELSVCIRFYNLSVGNFSFSGCVDLEAHVLHFIEEKYDLGCFKVGNSSRVNAVDYLNRLNRARKGFIMKSYANHTSNASKNDKYGG